MNNFWPTYIYPYGWYNTSPSDAQENFYDKFFHPIGSNQQQQQQTNPSHVPGQYANPVTATYQSLPVVTAPTISHAPSVYNHLASVGYEYPYYGYQPNAITNVIPQYPVTTTNLWSQASATMDQTSAGLTSILESLQLLTIRALQNTSNSLGQSLFGSANDGHASNPFRVATPFPPSPPPRLRRQRLNTSAQNRHHVNSTTHNRQQITATANSRPHVNATAHRVIQKKTPPPKKTFSQAFIEANHHQNLAALAKIKKEVDAFIVPKPEPFETPGECPIERVRNLFHALDPKDDASDNEDSDEDTKVIDVEK